jgi:transporter family protein
MKGRLDMAGWVLPTLGYAVLLGAAGVTIKLALETIDWRQLVLWVPIAYACFSLVFIVANGTTLPLGRGGFWAAVTGLCAASSLILLFYALTKGEASIVIPIGSAYPIVTLAGSALFLNEGITATKVVGVALVVAGVVVISR